MEDSKTRIEVIDEVEDYLIDSFNHADLSETLSIGKTIQIIIQLCNQLKDVQ